MLNAELIEDDDLLRKLMGLLLAYRGMIRVTILKNIALVTYALITLFHGARGGNGWLSKAALARCLPLGTGPKEREQRLYRFLDNLRLTPEILIPLHVALACGTKLRERLPMILDQTTIRGIETLLIGLVFEGGVLPIAFSCFVKKWIHKNPWPGNKWFRISSCRFKMPYLLPPGFRRKQHPFRKGMWYYMLSYRCNP